MPRQRSSPKAERVVRRVSRDGTVREYRYPAWKAPKGPRYGADTVGGLILDWQRSPEWARLAPASVTHYRHYAKVLERVGRLDAASIKRRDILMLRDAVAADRGHGAADGFLHAAGALFSWAVEGDRLEHSPVHKIKPLTRDRHLPAWSPRDAALALRELPEDLRRVVVLALHTGQRRGDLCAMRWDAYDGNKIRLKQQKTGTRLAIQVTPELRAELAVWRRSATALTILTDAGHPWNPMRLSERLPRALAKIDGLPRHLNVHGLRKLAAANLAAAGCSAREIGSMTGHKTLQMIQMYTESVDQEQLSEAAVHKLTTAVLQLRKKQQK